jgi:DNA-directed RNA polymerase alpha subunit
MAITSYRLYCQQCDAETVVRDNEMDNTHWKIVNLPYNEGVCAHCNDVINVAELDDVDEREEPIDLQSLDNIGASGAENLREAGYDTVESVAAASDEELLDVPWVGEKALFSLKEAAKAHSPQERWKE